MGYGLNRNPLF